MIETIIQPRFSETDAMTHIGNTVLPVWFEEARAPIFDKLLPGMKLEEWAFILAHIDVDFHQQTHLASPVNVKVGVSKIGSKSFTVYHEAWQNGVKTASGNAVIVHFDFTSKQTSPLSEGQTNILREFLIDQGSD
ncbi:MAG: acyl-CoA thioesterase [Agarilytica sp.]